MNFSLTEIFVFSIVLAGLYFYKATQTNSDQKRSWYVGMILGIGELFLMLLLWALVRKVL